MSTLKKWALKLRMATSAAFCLWHPGGTNSMLNLCVSRMWLFMFSETSLLSTCFLGTMLACFSWLRSAICPYHLCILATFHGFNKDGNAVNFDHHDNIFVALLRVCRKLACLAREHGFTYLVRFSVYIAYFLAMELLRGVACFKWDRSFFGGACIFLSLV